VSVWGNIYADRKDAVGRIMHAFEKRANGYHSTAEWRATRDDGTGELGAEPNDAHPDMVDAIENEIEAVLRAEIEKLEAFKTYVHKRLDAASVPRNPEPEENAKHGCRVEGRLNHLERQLASAKKEAQDWQVHWRALDRERKLLGRCITVLRSALKANNALASIDWDDDKRRRFEKRERVRR
jgi:hypothetical protein